MTGAELALIGMVPARRATGSRAARTRGDERGMVSAEWAVGILAAIAIAGVLLAVVTNGQVQDALLKFILFVIGKFAEFAQKG